jgi:hypothetical protein
VKLEENQRTVEAGSAMKTARNTSTMKLLNVSEKAELLEPQIYCDPLSYSDGLRYRKIYGSLNSTTSGWRMFHMSAVPIA